MKKRLFGIGIILLALLLATGALPVAAEVSGERTSKRIYGEIISFNVGETEVGTVEEWRDSYIVPKAGMGSEWYALALAQSSETDLSAYGEALSLYAASNVSAPPVTKQKYALSLAASGRGDPYISSTLESTVGRSGLMSYVWGLHLLNNGYESPSHTREGVIGEILSRQRTDGGWSVTGNSGDVDSTAMVIQALAPMYDREDIRLSVDRGLEFLSKAQLDSGELTSYGVANAESAAQVVIALSALGIDCESDSRFIKNGNSLFEVMLLYRTDGGGYSHARGGAVSAMATSQVFCAAAAYERMLEGKGSLYILDRRMPIVETAPPAGDSGSSNTAEDGGNGEAPRQNGEKEKDGWLKVVLCLAAAIAGGIFCLVMFLVGKRGLKRYILPILITALAIGVICFADIKSADSYYGEDGNVGEPAGHITLSVRCDSIKDSGSDKVPEGGVLLDEYRLAFYEGETVSDILVRAAKEKKLQLEIDGSGEASYVRGINYIYEFDFGELSGWVYRVNGEIPSKGCGSYKLSDGDCVELVYSLEAGRDIE